MNRAAAILLAVFMLVGGASGAWLITHLQSRTEPQPPRPPQPDPAQGGFPGVPPGFPGGGGPPFPGGQTDHKDLVAALMGTFEDDDADVRQAAGKALARIGRQAVKPLVAILEDGKKPHSLRAQAVDVLGQMGAQANEALPDLARALKDKDKDIRKKAALAIAQIVTTETTFPGFQGGFPGVPPIGGPGVAPPGFPRPPMPDRPRDD